MDVLNRLRELLVAVYNLDSPDMIKPEQSLVKDLGTDSIDFVEIIFIIEKEFGVTLKTSEIILGGESIDSADIFSDDELTQPGADLLNKNFPDANGRFMQGMTKVDLFTNLTVQDLANIITMKINKNRD